MKMVFSVISRFFLFIGCLISILGNISALYAAENSGSLSQFLLPRSHSLNRPLKNLCVDPTLFDSRERLEKKGFHVKKRMRRGLMVLSHPTIKGFLIKKFRPIVSEEMQLANYLSRIEGARKLAEFIQNRKLTRLVVPKKWLYRLPGSSGYILLVEKIDICGGEKDPDGETGRKYASISRSTLRELCVALYHFRGLDSVLTNLPFTRRNQIAFIDTEKWAEQREGFLLHVLPYLNAGNRAYVEKVRLELQTGERR